jgi:phosphatidylglycerophosphate synthase
MIAAKQVADLLTFSRLPIALIIGWAGVTLGPEGLEFTAWLLMLSWMTDVMDGSIARRAQGEVHTWIGDRDLEFDVIQSCGVLIYLLAAGFLDLRIAGLYLVLWALIFWRWGFMRSLGMLVQAPIYGYFISIALGHATRVGLVTVLWVMAVTALTWPKFPREVVPGFLSGMRAVWKKYRSGQE